METFNEKPQRISSEDKEEEWESLYHGQEADPSGVEYYYEVKFNGGGRQGRVREWQLSDLIATINKTGESLLLLKRR